MSGLTRRSLLYVVALSVLPAGEAFAAPQTTPVPAPADSPYGAPVSMLIQNSGPAADCLTIATSPVAGEVRLHATDLDHGQRVMREVSEIPIPARSVISLEPGARHLMLIGLRQSLVQGEVFPLSLHFAGAGEVLIDARVRRRLDAAGIPEPLPAVAGSLTILHASAPPATASHQ